MVPQDSRHIKEISVKQQTYLSAAILKNNSQYEGSKLYTSDSAIKTLPSGVFCLKISMSYTFMTPYTLTSCLLELTKSFASLAGTIVVPNDDSSDSEDLDLGMQSPRETSMEIPQDEVYSGKKILSLCRSTYERF